MDEWHNYIFKLFLILASLGYRMSKFSFSDVCSTTGITPGGGPAVANSRLKRGCTNTCQPTMMKPEVHVIAHIKAVGYVDSYENPKVETLRASDHCVYVCAYICVCLYTYIYIYIYIYSKYIYIFISPPHVVHLSPNIDEALMKDTGKNFPYLPLGALSPTMLCLLKTHMSRFYDCTVIIKHPICIFFMYF